MHGADDSDSRHMRRLASSCPPPISALPAQVREFARSSAACAPARFVGMVAHLRLAALDGSPESPNPPNPPESPESPDSPQSTEPPNSPNSLESPEPRASSAPARAGARTPRSRPIRVVLAEDHAFMRDSLRRLLDGADDVRVVAEARNQGAAVRAVRDGRPHVLVLDLRLPGGSSIDTVLALRDRAPDTRVIVTTMESSPAYAQRAFAAGATGFVAKDLADDELVEAVRTAARGGRYAGSRVAHVLRPLLVAASL